MSVYGFAMGIGGAGLVSVAMLDVLTAWQAGLLCGGIASMAIGGARIVSSERGDR